MKKIKQTLKAHIPNLEEICTKFLCFYSGSVKLQMHENGILFTPVKCTHAPGFLGLHDTLPCVLIPVSCLFCDLYLPCHYVPHSLRVKASSHDKEQQLEQNCTQTFTWVGSFAYKTFW